MNCILLSIIIPVYNVECYLLRCLESVPVESDGVELIIVDDGSVDDSGKLADKFAEGKKNVRVLHKQNGGLSDARNYGLLFATGKYVFFVDSDDYVDRENLINLLANLKDCNQEVLAFDSTIVQEGNSVSFVFSKTGNCQDGVSFLKTQLINHSFKVAVWNYIFLKRFLESCSVPFEKGLLQEDTLWTPIVLSKAKTIIYNPFNLYFYCIRGNSISTHKDLSKNLSDLIFSMNKLLDYFSCYDSLLFRLVKDYLVNNYLSVFAQDHFYKKDKQYILQYRYLVKDVYFARTRFKLLLYGISKRLYYLVSNGVKKH